MNSFLSGSHARYFCIVSLFFYGSIVSMEKQISFADTLKNLTSRVAYRTWNIEPTQLELQEIRRLATENVQIPIGGKTPVALVIERINSYSRGIPATELELLKILIQAGASVRSNGQDTPDLVEIKKRSFWKDAGLLTALLVQAIKSNDESAIEDYMKAAKDHKLSLDTSAAQWVTSQSSLAIKKIITLWLHEKGIAAIRNKDAVELKKIVEINPLVWVNPALIPHRVTGTSALLEEVLNLRCTEPVIIAMMQLLVKAGAAINVHAGRITPLHRVLSILDKKNNSEALDLLFDLIEKGAILIEPYKGKSLLEIAEGNDFWHDNHVKQTILAAALIETIQNVIAKKDEIIASAIVLINEGASLHYPIAGITAMQLIVDLPVEDKIELVLELPEQDRSNFLSQVGEKDKPDMRERLEKRTLEKEQIAQAVKKFLEMERLEREAPKTLEQALKHKNWTAAKTFYRENPSEQHIYQIILLATQENDEAFLNWFLAQARQRNWKMGQSGAFVLLQWAAARGHVDCMDFLLEIPSVARYFDTAFEARTPLQVAASQGNDKMVALLLTAGANIDGGYAHHEDPLMLALDKAIPFKTALLVEAGKAVIEVTGVGKHLPLNAMPGILARKDVSPSLLATIKLLVAHNAALTHQHMSVFGRTSYFIDHELQALVRQNLGFRLLQEIDTYSLKRHLGELSLRMREYILWGAELDQASLTPAQKETLAALMPAIDELFEKNNRDYRALIAARKLSEHLSAEEREATTKIILAVAQPDVYDIFGKTAYDYVRDVQDGFLLAQLMQNKVPEDIKLLKFIEGKVPLACIKTSIRVINDLMVGDRHSSLKGSLILPKELIAQERAIIQSPRRAARVLQAFNEFLEDHTVSSFEELPRVGFCFSGGGVRAMLETIGWLSGAKKLKFLDTALYATGLSGSTWALNPWVASGLDIDKYKEQLLPRLVKSPKEYLHAMDALKVATAYARKLFSGQASGLVIDLYGMFLASLFLADLEGIENPYEFGMSQLLHRMQEGKFPYIISTAVCGNIEEQERPTFEFAPLASGSFDKGHFVPTWALGRNFHHGKQVKPVLCDVYGMAAKMFAPALANLADRGLVAREHMDTLPTILLKSLGAHRAAHYFGIEPSLGYLMGICGSALSIGTSDILLELYEKIKPLAGDSCSKSAESAEGMMVLVRTLISHLAGYLVSSGLEKAEISGLLNSALEKGKEFSDLFPDNLVAEWRDTMRSLEQHPQDVAKFARESMMYGNFAAATLHNFGYGIPGSAGEHEATISLVDGGFQVQDLKRLNIGIMPQLQRKLDLIFVLDASREDLTGAPSLQATEKLVQKLNKKLLEKIKSEQPGLNDETYLTLLDNDERTLHLPKIDLQKYPRLGKEHITLIEDDTNKKAPLIVYMPGIGNAGFKNPHLNPLTAKHTDTFNFTYEVAESRDLVDLITFNVEQSLEVIKKAYKRSFERKAAKR